MIKRLMLAVACVLAFSVGACESPTADAPAQEPAVELLTAAYGPWCLTCPDGLIMCGNPPPGCDGA